MIGLKCRGRTAPLGAFIITFSLIYIYKIKKIDEKK